MEDPIQGGYLHAWVDFDGDGSWRGPWEAIVNDTFVENGDTTFTFDVPGWITTQQTYVRVRLNTMRGLTPRRWQRRVLAR